MEGHQCHVLQAALDSSPRALLPGSVLVDGQLGITEKGASLSLLSVLSLKAGTQTTLGLSTGDPPAKNPNWLINMRLDER